MAKTIVNNNIKLKSGGGIINDQTDGLQVDAGTTTGKVVVVGASDKLPAIDGSNLTNLPTQPNFQAIPYYAGTQVTHHLMKITSNTDGSVVYIAHTSSSEWTLNRLEKDSSGQYFITHTVSSASGYGSGDSSLAIVGNYLYFSMYDGSDSRVFRYSASDLSGKQNMTISGTKFGSNGGGASFSDGTNLYIYKSDSVFSKYTISGTTITFDSDITYTGAGRIDNGGSIGDGSNVYMAATTATSIIIKKYNFTGGAAVSTKSTFYIISGFANQGITRLFIGKSGIIGLAYGYSPFDGSTVTGAVMNLNYVSAS